MFFFSGPLDMLLSCCGFPFIITFSILASFWRGWFPRKYDDDDKKE
jgi:hypothetical protein